MSTWSNPTRITAYSSVLSLGFPRFGRVQPTTPAARQIDFRQFAGQTGPAASLHSCPENALSAVRTSGIPIVKVP